MESAGGAAGLTIGVIIIVKRNAKASLTIPAISFLLNTGANLIKPKSLANTIKPAENHRANSGNIIDI
jgi:hypothetical protein